MQEKIETQYLVLRKIPYSETSLIIGGISPDLGQTGVLIRGGRRLGKRQFPVADLLRLVNMNCHLPKNADLAIWNSGEVVKDFSKILTSPKTKETAAEICSFVQKNVHQHLPCHRFFQAVIHALQRLSEVVDDNYIEVLTQVYICRIGVFLHFLHENGELNSHFENPAETQRLRQLLDFCVGLGDLQLSPSVWQQLHDWAEDLTRKAGYL